MAIAAPQTTTATEHPESAAPPSLAPLLAPRWALGLRHLLVCALFGVLFLYLNYLPLWHTDLWSHVAYGHEILTAGALPAEDPLMPLAEGVPIVDTAWLSQVTFALVERWGGAEWLSNLYALTVLATYLVLARVFYLLSGRLGLSVLGTLLTLAVGWSRLSTIRPEIFGVLLFATLLWLLVSATRCSSSGRGRSAGLRSRTWVSPCRMWLLVPPLFALWANLHGSFLCGIAVLGCYCLGRAVEVARESRSLRGVLSDRSFRRWLLLTELAIAATLVNPYGIDLWIYSVQFAANENLANVMEWQPLAILAVGGREFALSWVLLVVVLRHSRRRVTVAEVLLLGVFSVAAATSLRMMAWYAPVVVLVLMPHIAEISARLWPASRNALGSVKVAGDCRDPRRSFRYSLGCVLVVWVSFALSGLSRPLLGGTPRPAERLYSSATPRGISSFLRENPNRGQLYNPQWWGDWLAWDGPPGQRLFMTTHMHVAPRQVWRDYLRISAAEPGWRRALDRYSVRTVVVDKEGQPLLAQAIRREPDWQLLYEDAQGMVLKRAELTGEEIESRHVDRRTSETTPG